VLPTRFFNSSFILMSKEIAIYPNVGFELVQAFKWEMLPPLLRQAMPG
jgi:hypothetical protein